MSAVLEPAVLQPIANAQSDLMAIRRDIHAHPELAFNETRTASLVAKSLRDWGLEVHEGIGKTGVVGLLSAGSGRKTIGLRADMDALPLQEHNKFDHRSKNDGRMHACGHDGHTAMLLGAAQYLAKHRNFDGSVRFVFQPAEEGGNCGAKAMIDDGMLTRFPCDVMFAMHNIPGIPEGHIALRVGPSMASSNRFDIVITGKGGHAAMPQNTVDPILVATNLVQSLQTLVSRSKNPLDMAVISVTQFHAGDAYNIIPNECEIKGTVRTFSLAVLDMIQSGIERLCRTIPEAYGARAELKFVRSYPPLVNHATETAFAADVAEAMLGTERVHRDTEPLTGSEDFAYFLQEVPGSYLFIGNGDGDHRAALHGMGPCQLHNPSYDFNDRLLPIGASYWVRLVETYLRP